MTHASQDCREILVRCYEHTFRVLCCLPSSVRHLAALWPAFVDYGWVAICRGSACKCFNVCVCALHGAYDAHHRGVRLSRCVW